MLTLFFIRIIPARHPPALHPQGLRAGRLAPQALARPPELPSGKSGAAGGRIKSE